MKILFKCRLLLLASIQAEIAINARQLCRPPAPQLSREPIQRKFRMIDDAEVFVAEDVTGELGIYGADKNQLLAAMARKSKRIEPRSMARSC
jgi:hypothetical protein